MLNLSKLEANKMVFHLEWTDLASLGADVLHSFDFVVPAGKVRLVEDFAALPSVQVDRQRIRQLLFNLIGNAVKFTELGEIRLKIAFQKTDGQETGTGTLTLAVADTGCGITPENQQRLMQPFVQINKSDAQKGTGLGLFICRQLAMRMGGALTLESEFGKGSTFTVTIQNVSFSTLRQDALADASTNTPALSSKLRILIVDDVSVNRHVLQAMLKRLDVEEVTPVDNGLAALEALRSAPDGFDVILTDMWMPEMDGKALVHEIRRDPRWKDLPVYAVTADAEAQKTSSEAGFTGLLLKPVTLDKLRKLLS